MGLFAEDAGTADGLIALLMALSSILGGAVIWLANYLSGRRAEQRAAEREKRKEDKEDERTIVDHYEKLQARMELRMTEMEKNFAVAQQLVTRAIAHVRYLEGLMESKGMKFRPFDPHHDGSGPHAPLPTGREGGSGTG